MLWFHRGLLLVSGFLFSVGMLFCLCLQAATQQPEQLQPIMLPCAVEGTQLVAEDLVCYEGQYLEDGSVEEVVDVSALVIRNHGLTMVEHGVVTLEMPEGTHTYEIYMLPPGEAALVLEKQKTAFSMQNPVRCYGWEKQWRADDNAAISVLAVDMRTLSVTNRTGSRLERVKVLFKTYDSQSRMFLGGIVYEAVIENLLPGQTVQITPYYFVRDYSRVVGIELLQG